MRIWSLINPSICIQRLVAPKILSTEPDLGRIDDINSEDVYEEFPLFQNATALEHILREGEMIYIPSGWWHHGRSIEYVS